MRAPHLSPPRSRRRATLRALKAGGKVLLGFNAEKSNRIIDMAECHILRPELFALVEPLRGLLGLMLGFLLAQLGLVLLPEPHCCHMLEPTVQQDHLHDKRGNHLTPEEVRRVTAELFQALQQKMGLPLGGKE